MLYEAETIMLRIAGIRMIILCREMIENQSMATEGLMSQRRVVARVTAV